MNLYIKQRVFALTDTFSVCDETQCVLYTVRGEFLSFGKKLHIYDSDGQERGFVCQKVFSFLPRYQIFLGGTLAAEMRKEFTFFRQEYTVDGPGFVVDGDFLAHDYTVSRGSETVARVSKAWLTWGDTYELAVSDTVDPVLALAVMLVIDACNEPANT